MFKQAAGIVLALALLSALLQLGFIVPPDLAAAPAGDAIAAPVALDPEERGLLDTSEAQQARGTDGGRYSVVGRMHYDGNVDVLAGCA